MVSISQSLKVSRIGKGKEIKRWVAGNVGMPAMALGSAPMLRSGIFVIDVGLREQPLRIVTGVKLGVPPVMGESPRGNRVEIGMGPPGF